MSKITIDTQLSAQLRGLSEPLEICDGDGKTVGHFLPEEVYRKLLYSAVEAACPHSREELERRRQEFGGLTLPEFWKTLGIS